MFSTGSVIERATVLQRRFATVTPENLVGRHPNPMADVSPEESMLTVNVVDMAGSAVVDATVCIVGRGLIAPLEARTDHVGSVTVDVNGATTVDVQVYPRATFWCAFRRVSVQTATTVAFTMQPISFHADNTVRHFLRGRICGPLSAMSGKGVKIAIIDTGVDAHYDLPPIVKGGSYVGNVQGSDWSDNGTDHGTFVAGIIAGRNQHLMGVAPDVELHAYRICPPNRLQMLPVDVASAINAATIGGADIINLSAGFQADSTDVTGMKIAIMDAVAAGVLIVASAGNDALRVRFPASLPDVIAVGALGYRHTIPPFSTHATRSERVANMHDEFVPEFSNFGMNEVDFAGPGLAVISTVGNNSYSTRSGTSVAAPLISAIAARIMEANGFNNQTRDQWRLLRIRNELRRTARALGFDPKYVGAGFPRM